VGQSTVKKKVLLLRAVEVGSEFSPQYSNLSIHRFMVLLSVDETRAIIWKNSELSSDIGDLVELSEEYSKPVVISTEKFGDMTLNREYDWVEGKILWVGYLVSLNIAVPKNESMLRGLQIAETLFDEQSSWSKKVNDYAAVKLLPSYNDGWKVDDGPDMTPEQFISKIKLTSIAISDKGKFTFWHDDGGIFAGHYVEVSGTLETGMNHADTPG